MELFSKLGFIGLICLLTQGSWAKADYDVRRSVVKVYTEYNRHDFRNPWQKEGARSRSGSGAIIDGNRILTNAHVVADQTFIQVKCAGQAKKYIARVEKVEHHVDLAILTVDDPGFFKGRKPLRIGELPRVQDRVAAYGFPIGGTRISITEGIVTRIEMGKSVHSGLVFLSAQIDANINPGSSGGPVISDNRIAGVAYQGNAQKNIFGMIPAPVIQHFLKDIEDGQVNGVPSLGVALENMENPVIRKYYHLKESQSGELVVRIHPKASATGFLQPEDVVTKVDGFNIADDGTVEFRDNERISWAWLVQRKQMGDILDLEILRKGKFKTLKIPLKSSMQEGFLVERKSYDQAPSYFVFGGIVFTPLSMSYNDKFGGYRTSSLPVHLRKYNSEWITPEREEIIVISRVLSDEVNAGYSSTNDVVDSVNGIAVRNMQQLVQAFKKPQQGYHRIVTEHYHRIVLHDKECRKKNSAILKRNNISSDRSGDLKTP
jgi:S1-C subfamily serine protease